ncbi:uncharacterized protein V1516DRAFT_557363 [Lipomyces oligophaga]|uniref:uncharacterized protein n=1 Tax=Lipomyces oligophaga TaxID=45792 RepID=UPI0034CDE86B
MERVERVFKTDPSFSRATFRQFFLRTFRRKKRSSQPIHSLFLPEEYDLVDCETKECERKHSSSAVIDFNLTSFVEKSAFPSDSMELADQIEEHQRWTYMPTFRDHLASMIATTATSSGNIIRPLPLSGSPLSCRSSDAYLSHKNPFSRPVIKSGNPSQIRTEHERDSDFKVYTSNITAGERPVLSASTQFESFLYDYSRGVFNLSCVPPRPDDFPNTYLNPLIPMNESRRLEDVALYSPAFTSEICLLLSTLLSSVCTHFTVKSASISIMTADMQIIKCAVGYRQLSKICRHQSLETHTLLSVDPIVISDTTRDWRFQTNPVVVELQLKFWASAPIFSRNGLQIGALSLGDDTPNLEFAYDDRHQLQRFANQALQYLESELARQKLDKYDCCSAQESYSVETSANTSESHPLSLIVPPLSLRRYQTSGYRRDLDIGRLFASYAEFFSLIAGFETVIIIELRKMSVYDTLELEMQECELGRTSISNTQVPDEIIYRRRKLKLSIIGRYGTEDWVNFTHLKKVALRAMEVLTGTHNEIQTQTVDYSNPDSCVMIPVHRYFADYPSSMFDYSTSDASYSLTYSTSSSQALSDTSRDKFTQDETDNRAALAPDKLLRSLSPFSNCSDRSTDSSGRYTEPFSAPATGTTVETPTSDYGTEVTDMRSKPAEIFPQGIATDPNAYLTTISKASLNLPFSVPTATLHSKFSPLELLPRLHTNFGEPPKELPRCASFTKEPRSRAEQLGFMNAQNSPNCVDSDKIDIRFRPIGEKSLKTDQLNGGIMIVGFYGHLNQHTFSAETAVLLDQLRMSLEKTVSWV